jgi:histidinol-phosphate aminotransferase
MSGRPRVREDLAALEGYHSAQVSVDVRLNTNEAPVPPPPELTDAVAEAVRSVAWHRYPDRAATELRTAIGKLHDVGAEQVFAANGSNEVLQTVLLTFAGAGRSVVTFEPTYALHGHLARITGARTVEGERAADFSLDVDEVERVLAVEQPAVTFLCSPNNPTGMVDEADAVRAVLDRVAAIDGLLVVDEAYGQFASWSATELLGEDVPLVVTRTYSKTWAMAAFRLGYLLGPAWLVAELDKVVLPYHLDGFKQVAGRLALDFVDDMERRVATIVSERERLQAALAELGATVWPSGANFILFRPPGRDGHLVWQSLVDRSVLVRDTSSWRRLHGCLRVTVGTSDENDRFLTAMGEILR